MTGDIVAMMLGLSGPEDVALKIGQTIVNDLFRHPQPQNSGPVEVLSQVPGRMRVRVDAMRKSPSLAARIEGRLVAVPGVLEAAASPVTGTVLVRYDERAVNARTLRLVIEFADAALRAVPAEPESQLEQLMTTPV